MTLNCFWFWKFGFAKCHNLFYNRLNFVHPCRWLSVCNLDTRTGTAWKRGSIPIEFFFQFVHLVASRRRCCCCCCCCCCFVFYYCFMFVWWHSSSCFSLTWCSLINFPAIPWQRGPRYTTPLPANSSVEGVRIPVSFTFLVLLSFLSLCFHSSIYLSVAISFSFSLSIFLIFLFFVSFNFSH